LDELRQQGGGALRGPASSWALDEVTRLHHEIRDGAGAGKNTLAPRTGFALTQSAADMRRGPTTAPVDAEDPLPAPQPDTGGRFERKWLVAAAAAALVLVIGGGFGLFYNRARLAAEQAAVARQRAEAAATAANERIETAQRDAAAQIEIARDAASRAQITSDVLAASDLMRFNLVGSED